MLKLILSISYPDSITEDDVRLKFLQYSGEMVSIISNSLIKAKYDGPVPIDSKTSFAFTGRGLPELNRESALFFENTVKLFLNDMFALSSVNISDVRVDAQLLKGARQRRLGMHMPRCKHLELEDQRVLQDKAVGTLLTIATTLVGEYKPPPVLDLGVYIDEIFRERGQYFIENIQENKAFKGVVEMSTESVTKQYVIASTNAIYDSSFRSIFELKEFSAPLYIMAILLFTFVIAYVRKDLKKRHEAVRILGMQELMESRDSPIKQSSEINLFEKDDHMKHDINTDTVRSHLLKSYERIYSVCSKRSLA